MDLVRKSKRCLQGRSSTSTVGLQNSPLCIVGSKIGKFSHQRLQLELLRGADLHPDRSVFEAILTHWHYQFLGRQEERISAELVRLTKSRGRDLVR